MMDMIVIPVILEVAVVSMVVMVPVVEMAMLGRLASEAQAAVRIVAQHSLVDYIVVAVVSMVVMVPVLRGPYIRACWIVIPTSRLASEAMAAVRIVAKHSMVDKAQIVAVRIVAKHSMVVPRSIQHLWTTRFLPGTGPPLIISKHPQHRLPTPWGHTGLIKAPEQLNGERNPAAVDWRRVQQTHLPRRRSTRLNSCEKPKEVEPPWTSASGRR